MAQRQDLIFEKMMGECVFTNCASFLRISDEFLSTRANVQLDVLDTTRIHPQDYAFARKIAADALDVEQDGEDDNPSQVVEELLAEGPEKLESIQLGDYAKKLFETKGLRKQFALDGMKTELMDRDRELRTLSIVATGPQIFTMLTGEILKEIDLSQINHRDQIYQFETKFKPTLAVGQVITTKVTRKALPAVFSRLPCGIEVRLTARELFDDGEDESQMAMVEPGHMLTCVVTDINVEELAVRVDAKEVSVREARENQQHLHDMYYSEGAEMKHRSQKC